MIPNIIQRKFSHASCINMISLRSLLLLLATSQLVSSDGCSPELFSPLHYWREPTGGPNRYLRTVYPDLTYEIHYGVEEEYLYLTTFYQCPDGYTYISTKAQSGAHYVANDADTWPDVGLMLPGTFAYPSDRRLFRYGGDDAMDSVNMRSYATDNLDYVAGEEPSLVRFSSDLFWWWTVPYLTAEADAASFRSVHNSPPLSRTTSLQSSLRIRNRQFTIGVSVRRRSTPDRLIIRLVSPSTNLFQFEMIKYRIHTERAYTGRVAIVLRSNPTDYLTLDVTRDAVVHTPLIHRPTGLKYNRIRLNAYDDVMRSRNSTVLKPDIKDQNVVDERFFEVLRQQDGSTRLRSMLNKDLYVAVARFNHQHQRRLELVIAPLSNLTNSIINYNFQMGNTDAPAVVRRQPNFKFNSRR